MNNPVEPKTLAQHIKDGLYELEAFTSTPEFHALLDDLWALPIDERPAFVANVILNLGKLNERGIRVPPGIKLQRSAFRDNRPTLFCVVRYIPDGLQWSKVTITYDNPSGSPALSYPSIADRFQQEVGDTD